MSSTLATSCEELTHWKRLCCWEGLGAEGEGDDRGWDGWLASPIDGHEFKWTPGDGDGQGGLACCDSWGRGESDMTERLNWTECVVCLPYISMWVVFTPLLGAAMIWGWMITMPKVEKRGSESHLESYIFFFEGEGWNLYDMKFTTSEWTIHWYWGYSQCCIAISCI